MFALLDMIIVRPIVNILFVIYSLVGDFGLAIILFTIIVKLLTWPIMKRQLHQTKLMREIQPELAEIKKNCKGNRQMESLQMMDLYKRKNIKPFRSVLTLLIQLPIFIGLFTAINVTVRPRINGDTVYTAEHSAYSFVEPMNHISDLISQQTVYLDKVAAGDTEAKLEFAPKLFGVVDLSVNAGFTSYSSVIILIFALASAFAQFVMSKQQDPSRYQKGKKKLTFRQLMKEAANGKEASQEDINAVTQGQMTFMMPLMMLFIMINLPGAIVFYYLLNNLITIAQQKIVLNRNYTEMEAAADKKILKELHDAQEAVIVRDDTKKSDSKTHYQSSQNKKDKTHITRIKASDKKKRRK